MPYLYNIASTFIVQVKCMPVIYCFCPDIQVTVDGVRNMFLMRPKTYTLLNLNISDALNGRRMLILRRQPLAKSRSREGRLEFQRGS
jgi:hypothetical protein